MKRLFILVICILLIALTIYKVNDITTFLAQTLSNNHNLVIKNGNKYKKDYDFEFIKNSQEYNPHSIQDLKDIIFSVINNGWEKFTFYCPSEYESCTTDMANLTKDKITLAHINNYVHPYNSYSNLNTMISESGEITINITYLYTEQEIIKINQKVTEIIEDNYKKSDDDYTNLKKIHDYIINNTKYDIERNNTGESKYTSYTAYGPALEGFATCNGYTDLMAIILSELGFKNTKIATTSEDLQESEQGHVWNVVKIEDKWLHIDLTWDDPVDKDNQQDYLYHKYFLVTKEEMQTADDGEVKLEEHNFNNLYYNEFN